MKEKIFVLIGLIITCLSVQIFAAELKNNTDTQGIKKIRRTKNTSPEPPSNYFINQNFLTCGNSDVLIMTSCVDYEEDMPFCFNQHINIYNKKTSMSSSVNYDLKFDDGNQQLIANIDCKSVDNKNYLILENTNFGNCGRCEWIDVYSENAEYLGSTQGIYDSRYSSHFQIPKKIDAALSSGKTTLLARINISRTRPRSSR